MLFLVIFIDIIYLMMRRGRGGYSLQYHLFIRRLRELGIDPRNPGLDEITRVLILQAGERFMTGRRKGYNSQNFAPSVRFNEYGLYVISLRAQLNPGELNSIGLTTSYFNGRVQHINGGSTATASAEFIAFQYNMRHTVPVNNIVSH